MPAETQRSKKYSYKNQVEAGFKLAGSAGLTAERLEDAPLWKPPRGRCVREGEDGRLAIGVFLQCRRGAGNSAVSIVAGLTGTSLDGNFWMGPYPSLPRLILLYHWN